MSASPLIQAVLAATNPLGPATRRSLKKVERLLRAGASAAGCIDAMVERDECYFEATEQGSAAHCAAVAAEIALIPLLAEAGDTVSPEMLESALYNCAPEVQLLLRRLPVRAQK